MYEMGGKVDKSNYVSIPLKPIAVYNVLTDKEVVYQPPDIEIEKEDKYKAM